MSSPYFALLYALANIACMAAYIPQIISLWRNSEVRNNLVISTWWVWSVGASIDLAYVRTFPHSQLLQLMALFHLLACGWIAVFVTVYRLKIWWRERQYNLSLMKKLNKKILFLLIFIFKKNKY